MIDLLGELSHVMKNKSITSPDASKQWLDLHQPAKVIVKKNWFGPKVMLCVWCNFESVIHFEFVANGRAVDADLYFTLSFNFIYLFLNCINIRS